MKKMLSVLAACTFLLGAISCGGGSSNSTQNKRVTLNSMAGAWDFTATSPNFYGNLIAVEAIFTQDNSGNLSATGSVSANGPSGAVASAILGGSPLSAVSDMYIDLLGNACGSSDTGVRKMTGTINSSSQVSLTFDDGGETVTITGTLSPSANPPFSGTFQLSAPGCSDDGTSGNVTGVQAGSWAGTYSGAPYNNSGDNVTFTLTAGSNNAITGSGTDSQNGSFALTGNATGDIAAITSTSGTVVNNLFGYYDPQLGAKGSVVAVFFVGPSATSCANGAPLLGETCLYGVFPRQ